MSFRKKQNIMSDRSILSLIIRAGPHLCALSVSDVVEVMRPRAIETLAGAPEMVRGLSVIRGAPVPVVDLAKLLGDGEHGLPTRFVTLRTGERNVALSVDAVLGIRDIAPAIQSDLPPLMRDARPDLVDAVSTLDAELLLVLKAAKLLPEEVWNLMARQEE
jgi:purine-binding chemotaxis protein CheW